MCLQHPTSGWRRAFTEGNIQVLHWKRSREVQRVDLNRFEGGYEGWDEFEENQQYFIHQPPGMPRNSEGVHQAGDRKCVLWPPPQTSAKSDSILPLRYRVEIKAQMQQTEPVQSLRQSPARN